MQELSFDQWTAPIRALFAGVEREPAGIRCVGVLDGHTRGRLWADDPATPTWVVLQEAGFGTLYLGGHPTLAAMMELVDRLRQDSDVLVGLWPEDPRLELFPRPAEYEGCVLDFYHRDRSVLLERFLNLPAGLRLEPVTVENLRGRPSTELMIATHGSLERALEMESGYLIYKGDEVVCEATTGPAIRGMAEPGVETAPAYRGQGLATFLCAYLVRECERQGFETWWNCNKANLPSAGLARKLGYKEEKEYILLGWPKKGTKFD